MSLGLFLYGFAFILFIYIIFSIVRTKKFKTDDAIATLGIVVSILLAFRITPPITIPPEVTAGSTTIPSHVSLTSTPSNPPILLSEDFEDGKTQNFTYISGDWQIVTDESSNKVYDMNNTKGSGDWPTIQLGLDDWKDYEIKFRMRILDIGNGWTAIGFRKDQKGIGYIVGIDPTVTSLNYTTVSSWQGITSRQHSLQKNTWHWISIEAQGTEIKIIIDAVPVINTDDTRFSAGSVIIQVGDYSHAQFDDIQVMSLSK